MRLMSTRTWMVGFIALASAMAGCSQQRFGNLRSDADVASGPPKPAPALVIPNAPSVAAVKSDDMVQQATFLPKRDNLNPMVAEPAPPVMERPLSALYQRAQQRYATMDTYIYRLKRREVVAGKTQPEELIEVLVRNEPFSVHLKWLGPEGKGREVIYVKGKFKNEMQVLLAPSDPFVSLMPRTSISPDSPTARAKSRYPITETGFGPLIARFGQLATAMENGNTRGGTVKYLGRVTRPEFAMPVEAVHQVLPEGSDPLLPKGGQRWWFFNTESGLPVLVIAHDAGGEVEYYCHDHIIAPAHLDDDDFNPERLGRK
jgi:Protein of unknown function (DUF1571)